MNKMFILMSLILLFFNVGCVSKKVREEGKITCISVNKAYQKPDEIGFSCKDKKHEDERLFKYED